ncbi:MAG: hypothetical protein HN590_11930 [Calditrichaeota bacterium]|nr:hypothetical protein [Calditrichota bacterium]
MNEPVRSVIADWTSIIAGVMTVIGVPGLAIWSFRKRFEKLSALRVYRLMIVLVKVSMILLYWGVLLIPTYFLYGFLLVCSKGSLAAGTLFWEKGYAIAYLFSYGVTIPLLIFTAFIGAAIIYTGSSKPFQIIRDNWNMIQITFESSKYSSFKILDARYGAKASFNDVKSILSEIATDEKLEFKVGNDLFDDPIYGEPKRLYLKIEIGDEILEQEYNEGKSVTIFFDESRPQD